VLVSGAVHYTAATPVRQNRAKKRPAAGLAFFVRRALAQ
jgi:hypothetical protein